MVDEGAAPSLPPIQPRLRSRHDDALLRFRKDQHEVCKGKSGLCQPLAEVLGLPQSF